MPDALRLALGTFTAWRVPPPRELGPVTARRAMLLAPLTVLPVGAVWAALLWTAWRGWMPALVGGSVGVAASVLASRALHLDGLADTADGLSAGYDRERSLEVMRRGDVGPSGVAAIVLVLLVETASLASLATSAGGIVLGLTALLGSRLAPAIACRAGVPAARNDGLGHLVAGTVHVWGQATAAATLAAVVVVGGLAVDVPWYAALLVLAGAIACAWLVTGKAVRRLGGITGDTIGAAIELSLAGALVVAATAHQLLS